MSKIRLPPESITNGTMIATPKKIGMNAFSAHSRDDRALEAPGLLDPLGRGSCLGHPASLVSSPSRPDGLKTMIRIR